MDKHQVNLLVVDDEEFNRHILKKCLSDVGYAVTLAADGEEAWELLDGGKHDFSAVLLDRMMPRLDGMSLLARVKSDSRFARLPVIFQTAAANPSEIAEGLKAGAFYYLTKPINREVMLAVVQSAVNEHIMTAVLRREAVDERSLFFALLRRSEFHLRTLNEARSLAATLAGFYPDPQRALLGLSELLINAVEHGNLGISYKEKSVLLQEAKWEDEIERRLALPENTKKMVSVLLEHSSKEIRMTVTDCGKGFVWGKYMEMSPERAFDPNGRGIAMSRMMSFDSLEYLGNGNQVAATVKL
jgi:CheY-like chemotaxis protein